MFNVATSYFYQVRFFKPYMIPLSTAIFDPKWYHANKGNDFTFVNQQGVINGLRINPLRPPEECETLCRGPEVCATRNPKECEFLTKYYEHLCHMDFAEFIVTLDKYAEGLRKKLKFAGTPLFVFLFHEKPDNPCSERRAVMKWFEENEFPLQELFYPVEMYY